MDSEALSGCLKAALRDHEIGDSTPYEISFASKGKSGASFGFMQGDLAAKQADAAEPFRTCLNNAGFEPDEIDDLMAKLSVPCPTNPLTPEETQRVDAALLASQEVVDAMDGAIFTKVMADVDRCVAAAKASTRAVTPEALIFIALWINMTGAPTALLKWLAGKDPNLPYVLPAAPSVVDGRAITQYLMSTKYYTENPKNFNHMKRCVASALKQHPVGS